jgi:hypothetical protein
MRGEILCVEKFCVPGSDGILFKPYRGEGIAKSLLLSEYPEISFPQLFCIEVKKTRPTGENA